MAISPIGSSAPSLASLFAPQPAGKGSGLSSLFAPQQDGPSGLAGLFGVPDNSSGNLGALFATPKITDADVQAAADFQSLALQALAARVQLADPDNAGSSIQDIFAAPPARENDLIIGFSLPGAAGPGESVVDNILSSIFQPQHDLIGELLDYLG